MIVYQTICVQLLVVGLVFGIFPASGQNDRPIIGVLAQESPHRLENYGDTYFMAAYVSYIQMAGARVVPVRVGMPTEYYLKIFSNINGLIFPGGGVNLTSSLYAKAARQMYALAIKAKEKGDYFPIWGTCLGFELLLVLTSRDTLLDRCDAEDYMLPLSFTSDGLQSRLMADASKELVNTMEKYNVTANYHKECMTPKNFTKNAALRSFYRVIAVNKDRKGKEFVSMVEAHEYPFYGSQWHPEKAIFSWDVRKHLTHSTGAVLTSQYMANFFVNEARKSKHHYSNIKEEGAALIENYQPVYLGPPSFELDYVFNLTSSRQRNRRLNQNDVLKYDLK